MNLIGLFELTTAPLEDVLNLDAYVASGTLVNQGHLRTIAELFELTSAPFKSPKY